MACSALRTKKSFLNYVYKQSPRWLNLLHILPALSTDNYDCLNICKRKQYIIGQTGPSSLCMWMSAIGKHLNMLEENCALCIAIDLSSRKKTFWRKVILNSRGYRYAGRGGRGSNHYVKESAFIGSCFYSRFKGKRSSELTAGSLLVIWNAFGLEGHAGGRARGWGLALWGAPRGFSCAAYWIFQSIEEAASDNMLHWPGSQPPPPPTHLQLQSQSTSCTSEGNSSETHFPSTSRSVSLYDKWHGSTVALYITLLYEIKRTDVQYAMLQGCQPVSFRPGPKGFLW